MSNVINYSIKFKNIKFYHFGKIEHGKIELFDQRAYDIQVKRLEGKDIQITIAKRQYKRSDRQNRYYFGVVVDIIGNELGYSPEEIHELLKALFLKTKIPFKGNEVEIVKSTTALNTQEFEEYLEKIRIWASTELGVVIPLPNEIDLDAYADSLTPYL